MKPVDYVAIVIRLLAIAIFIYGLKAVGSSLQVYFQDQNALWSNWLFYSFHTIVPIVLAVTLWFFPNLIARKIIGEDSLKPSPLSAQSLLSILVATVGIFTFFYAFIDAWYWAFFSVMVYEVPYGYESPFKPDIISDMWATGIELALSLLLILKCKTIANFIIKISR